MPEYLHPGVYVQEVPAAVKPIEGASTSTAGFVGVADRGPVPGFEMPFGEAPRAPLVTSFPEYTRLFGSYRSDSFLTYAVQNFFDNGGRRAYISRVVVTDDPPSSVPASLGDNARLAATGLVDRETTPQSTIGVIASSPGAWANRLGLVVTDATQDAGRFKLLVLEDGLPVEAYDELSMDPDADGFIDTVVNSRSERVVVRAVLPVGVTPDVARPAKTETANVVELDGDGGAAALTVSSAVLLGGPLTIRTARSASGTPPTFRLVVLQGADVLERFDGLSMDPSLGNFVERKINGRSELISVRVPTASPPITDFAAGRPVDADTSFPSTELPTGSGITAGAGSDGRTPRSGELVFLGSAEDGSGLRAFDRITDVNILAIPGQGNDLVISGAMAYCKNRPLQDAFFVADLGVLSPAEARVRGNVPDPNDRDEARDFVRGLSTPNDYGAVYYPWIRVADPIGRGRNPMIALPPSGFVAGLYARIDNSRGVFKAPAGTEAGLAGALDLTADIQDADQDSLNPVGLNVIRRFPSYGIVSWGTRTQSIADPAWRYIPVRRTAIFLRTSIYRGIQWAVFEPNDAPLWGQLRLNVTAFMLTQFRGGAFQGQTPGDAFFVKVDASTTTQQDIDNGVVNILVGFAPLRPAEFVVLKLSQKVNQPAA